VWNIHGYAFLEIPRVRSSVRKAPNLNGGKEAAWDWAGIGAPRNTPTEIIDKLNREINAALADPKIKARLDDLGVTVFANSPADFAKHIADETEKWGKVIRAANIKPE
jgi:tripartite-type tricarboxylate transporter receptor subunit TctC